MQRDLTTGGVTGNLVRFALPLMAGNLLQQLYNLADTWVVGYYLGADALAAVGSAYALMVFLTSILLGLSMGSGAVFSMQFGRKDWEGLKNSMFLSFVLILSVALALNLGAFAGVDGILWLLQTPPEVADMMKEYLLVVFSGILGVFLYNYFASLLRAVGNSSVPLVFLALAAALNILLDLLFVLVFHWGVAGAGGATVIAQFLSGFGLMGYALARFPQLRPNRRHLCWNGGALKELAHFSFLTCIQQSVMNFGILMIQGLVNSFGPQVMAAFAAAVKIDSLAYMPAQDFGNAFSTYTAQNYGAGKPERIQKGIRSAFLLVFLFCLTVSGAVCAFAPELMGLFLQPGQEEVVRIGAEYLRMEGACYLGIGVLFLLYGYYRAVAKPGMSILLTVVSLGTRVVLAYLLAPLPQIGVTGIWAAVPVGWLLADVIGIWYYLGSKKRENGRALH